MTQNKLNEIAARQLSHEARDYVFASLMGIVMAFLLVAFATTRTFGSAPAAQVGEVTPASALSETAAEIQAHTSAVCGDLDAPEPAPIVDTLAC